MTLLVFIFQFRGQERATKEASYQNLMGRYNDFMMMQASNPSLNRLFARRLARYSKRDVEVTPDEAAVYGHLLIAYGILEEAFLLFQKKWIDQDTWDQWDTWLKVMLSNPEFVTVHETARGTFDNRFANHVSDLLKQNDTAKTT